MSHVVDLFSQILNRGRNDNKYGKSGEREIDHPFDLFSIVQELATVHFDVHDFEPLI